MCSVNGTFDISELSLNGHTTVALAEGVFSGEFKGTFDGVGGDNGNGWFPFYDYPVPTVELPVLTSKPCIPKIIIPENNEKFVPAEKTVVEWLKTKFKNILNSFVDFGLSLFKIKK
jgi:hypothetical protein